MSSASSIAESAPGAFAFGRNWRQFLSVVDERRVSAAVESLALRLGRDSLSGMRFLDAGSGSGLFSLAAVRLGAKVVSFDVDPQSVACTTEMKRRFAPEANDWEILSGSALDEAFLESLGTFDVVYSWGVLHHTGHMWRAIDLVQQRVVVGGRLWIALYNDQGPISDRWKRVKKLYQQCPAFLRTPCVVIVGGTWAAWRVACYRAPIALAGLLLSPIRIDPAPTIAPARVGGPGQRGMHWWYDLVDWIGGWPFEVARPEEVLAFLLSREFTLVDLVTVGGSLGCNEYVFRREDAAAMRR